MNIRDLSEFVATMARNPELQKEFVALAARYGVSFGDDQLSEAELESVSGGTATQESSTGLQQQSTAFGDSASLDLAVYMERQQQSTAMLSNMLKKMADSSGGIVGNLK
jgi:hypothetical protein